jgi:hypothetical protein
VNKRYRLVPPLQGLHPVSALVGRIYTEIEADKPDHPSCFEGEWVCPNSPCPVRVVRLRVKALYHQHLPRLRCPLCLRTLDFRHWLNVVALQEVPSAPLSRKRSGSRTLKRKRSPKPPPSL